MAKRDGADKAERDRPHLKAPRAAGPGLDALLRAAAARHGFPNLALLKHWRDVAGPQIARHARPVALRFPKDRADGGTLELLVDGAAVVLIQHQTPQILERANGFLGPGAIAKLKLRQGLMPAEARPAPRRRRAPTPEERQAIDRATAKVADPELRARLGALMGLAAADEG